MSEVDLAAKVVASLSGDGWDIFQEVKGPAGIADIVAIRNGRVMVVEVKRSFGFAVLGQADRWRYYAHWVGVAVPQLKRSKYCYRRHDPGRDLVRRVCDSFGIGVWNTNLEGWAIPPQLNRRAQPKMLLECLNPAQKNFAPAGSKGGSHWTPFKSTVRELRRFVKQNPGCTMKEAVDGIPHHYRRDSTAVSCLLSFIRMKVIVGIRIETGEGRAFKLYEEKAA